MAMQSAVEQRADELLASMRPLVVEMIERYDPSHRDVTFNQIEADAASRGDLLARELMKLALARQARATASEVQEARAAVVAGKSSDAQPAALRMTRIPGKPRQLKTMRGPIEYRREYLYFPDVQHGVFPPRSTAGDSGQRDDAPGPAGGSGKDC